MNDAKISQQSTIIADLNNALSAEQQRSGYLTQELSSLRDKCNNLETTVATANTEVDHLRQLLSTENQRLSSIQ